MERLEDDGPASAQASPREVVTTKHIAQFADQLVGRGTQPGGAVDYDALAKLVDFVKYQG